jgi:hypothetical protein
MRASRVGFALLVAALTLTAWVGSAFSDTGNDNNEMELSVPQASVLGVNVGQNATWTFNIWNDGGYTMPDGTTVVTETLASGEQFVSLSSNENLAGTGGAIAGDPTCTQSGQTVTCDLAAMPSASGLSVAITVKETTPGNKYESDSLAVPADDTSEMPGDTGGTATQALVVAAAEAGDTPYVHTGYDDNIGQAGMSVDGYTIPNGSGKAYYEYGTSKSYGKESKSKDVSGSRKIKVSATFTGLKLNKTYHFRLVVVIKGRKYYGDDSSATTFGGDGLPKNVTIDPKSISGGLSFSGKIETEPFPGPDACTGKVSVEIYNADSHALLVDIPAVKLKSNCSYSLSTHNYTAAMAKAAGKKGTIIAQASFLGNADLAREGSDSVPIL